MEERLVLTNQHHCHWRGHE